jgi:hypothetical protein
LTGLATNRAGRVGVHPNLVPGTLGGSGPETVRSLRPLAAP